MQEKEIQIPVVDPVELFGTNDSRLKIIKKHFPKLKIMARGQMIRVNGEPNEIKEFEEALGLIFWHLEKYNSVTENQLEKLLTADGQETRKKAAKDKVLVHGPAGLKVKARTANQAKMVELSQENDMVFAIGPAGTGKTYTAVALAVRALKDKEVKRIILTRPAVEAGENLGFLPGDLKEKLDPYMQPLYDALIDMLHYDKLADYIDKGVIEVAPLAFMRGRTLDKAFVILDEAQNATVPQIKMFLTRMGENAKFVITGDATQVDLPRKQSSGLLRAVDLLNDVKGIGIVRLGRGDVIRHKLVDKVIKAFEDDEKRRQEERDQEKKDR
ncbi:MAG: PhoH family protein [Flavobacteriales bacterium]|nr:PhoH family protein [Flavobacteriales bacterium]